MIKIENAVSETLLIPLYMKYLSSQEANPILTDPAACRLVPQIDYDFAKFNRAKPTRIGTAIRARYFDRLTADFIRRQSRPVVVILGCGLDSRRERIGSEADGVPFYQLDLEDVIQWRRAILPPQSNETLIAASAFDTEWMDDLHARHPEAQFLFVIEGVLMYFEEAQVQAFFQMVQRKLPGTQIVLDALFKKMVGRAQQHDALRQMGETPPEFRWGVGSADDVLKLAPGSRLVEEIGLSSICAPRYPFILRLLLKTRWGRENLDMRLMRIQL